MVDEVKRHPQCNHKDMKCSSMERLYGTCLLRNPFDCPFEPKPAKKVCAGCPDRFDNCMTKAECQEKVERIFREAEQLCPHIKNFTSWQALKEGVK